MFALPTYVRASLGGSFWMPSWYPHALKSKLPVAVRPWFKDRELPTAISQRPIYRHGIHCLSVHVLRAARYTGLRVHLHGLQSARQPCCKAARRAAIPSRLRKKSSLTMSSSPPGHAGEGADAGIQRGQRQRQLPLNGTAC